MTGAVAANFHAGSRSEILADYLLSSWGTVTPVRRQDDYGVDLFCTLTERSGQRAVVTDYYSVQVKSTDDPWVIEGDEGVRWLVDHPTPLFLAYADKARGVLSIYQTLARFLAGFWESQGRIEMHPAHGDEGSRAQWLDPVHFDLSALVLRVTIEDLLNRERLAQLREVLGFWVRTDHENCVRRQTGLLRMQEPDRYRVNELPAPAGMVEQGMLRPTREQLDRAVRSTVEALDCVGHQLLVDGDREGAIYASILLQHIRKTRGAQFAADPRWYPDRPWGLEFEVTNNLNPVLYPDRQPTYALEALGEIVNKVRAIDALAKAIEAAPPGAAT